MMAEGAVLFPDAHHIRLNTPLGVKVATYFRRINEERLGTQNMDTPAAIAAFINGEGGIYPTGTWMIGSFEQEATTPGRPLYNSYAVFPYPHLAGQWVEYVSGHTWVVPTRKRTPAQRAAIARFFKFMAAHNYDWARTGHIPAFKAVLNDPRSGHSRTARTSRRWPRSGARCRATCSGRTRSRESSVKRPRPRSSGRRASRRPLGGGTSGQRPARSS